MKANSKYILTFLILLIALIEIRSQQSSATNKILNTAFSSNAVKFQYEKSDQLKQLDYAVPLIEKIELRSETNDFDLKKQDLSIRLSPNNKKHRRAHRLYHESVQHMTEMQCSTEIMKALSERYEMITDYAFAKEMLAVENIRKAVAMDKVKLLKKMISLSSFDIVGFS